MNICPVSGKPCFKKKGFHITEIRENKAIHTLDLCEECIKQYVDLPEPTSEESKPEPEPELNEVETPNVADPPAPVLPPQVSGIVEFFQKILQTVEQQSHHHVPQQLKEAPVCPKCGSTAMTVYKTGRFGCDECYRTFNVENLLMQLHGATQHVGKVPKKWKEKQILQQQQALFDNLEETMQGKMAAWLVAENYESAAKAKQMLGDFQTLKITIDELKERLQKCIEGQQLEEAAAIQKQIDATLMRCYEMQDAMLKL